MFKFFGDIPQENNVFQGDPYFGIIDNLFTKTNLEEIKKKLPSIIQEIDTKIKNESLIRAEKIWRYLLIKFFHYLINTGLPDISFSEFLEGIGGKYLNFVNLNLSKDKIKNEIFDCFILELIKNEYYFIKNFINNFIEKSGIDVESLEDVLRVRLAYIIEKQSDAYLSDKRFSKLKNERAQVVELLLNIYEKNKLDDKYVELASRELHDIEDYKKLIKFLIVRNLIDDAIYYCYQGIENDKENQPTYFEILSGIYEKQNNFEKAFAFIIKSLYLTNNKAIYLKIKKIYAEHPEAREYNARIINFLREHNQNNLLIEIFLEENRLEDAIEAALSPEIRIEEKLWVAEYTKKAFPNETLVLYREIITYYSTNYCNFAGEKNYCKMVLNCFREIKKIYSILGRENEWHLFINSQKNTLPEPVFQELSVELNV